MADIVKVQESLDTIDLQRVAEYSKKLKDIGTGFNKMMAPVYVRDFIIGFDISSVMLARAVQAEAQAKAVLETAEAIAFLDGAPTYFKNRDEKATVEGRKAYVALDTDVREAKDVHARALAMVSLLRNKVIEFKEAIGAIKMLQYDGFLSPNEGMK